MHGVEFRDVSYGTVAAPVLQGVSMAVGPGETLALVGASGAGKTTLLKLVNRLLVPDAGAIFVLGRDVRQWDPIRLRRSIGYVIQEVGLFPHVDVAGNIAMLPRLEGWPAARIADRVRELLELIALPPDVYAHRWPDELSGGQRQRVGVARALACDPPVLLLDEPFGALDPVTRRQLQQEFRRIQERVAKCVILVTHDVAEALTLGDRVGVLADGRLIWSGTPREIAHAGDPRVRALVETSQLRPPAGARADRT